MDMVLVSGVLVTTNTLGDSTHKVNKLYGASVTATADAVILLKDGDTNGKVLARMGIEASAEASDHWVPHFAVPVGSGIVYVDAGGATVAVTIYFG